MSYAWTFFGVSIGTLLGHLLFGTPPLCVFGCIAGAGAALAAHAWSQADCD